MGISIGFKAKYSIGQMVYLRHDPEQCERMVTYYVYNGIFLTYMLSCGEAQTQHFEYEITDTKNILYQYN